MADSLRKSLKEESTVAPPLTQTTDVKNNQQQDVPKDGTEKVHKPPSNVKSNSWKRSDKQISNVIGGKKTKSLPKRSSAWSKLANGPGKMSKEHNANEPTSACRPGTLYSDVLIGAGTSSAIKSHVLAQRNAAQKKLTKALLKSPVSNQQAASHSEPNTDLFPNLLELKKTFSIAPTPSSLAKFPSTNKANTYDHLSFFSVTSDSNEIDSNDDGENADMEILPESSNNSHPSSEVVQNGFDSEVSFGNFLLEHIHAKKNSSSENMEQQVFTDIPGFNFIDVSSETYPKFLCQFDDDHYLNMETMALLGLKLALGNNAKQANFKF